MGTGMRLTCRSVACVACRVNHLVHSAALRLNATIRQVMEQNKWDDCRFCCKCGGDELYFENPINICDWYKAYENTFCTYARRGCLPLSLGPCALLALLCSQSPRYRFPEEATQSDPDIWRLLDSIRLDIAEMC